MPDKELIPNKSEKPLDFETDDFSTKDFLDLIKDPINKKIKYFSVLMSKKEGVIEPLMFWLNTGEKEWYRFFIDAWLVHWTEYSASEKEEIIEDDFEGEDEYFVKNLMKELGLADKMIEEIEVSRFFENQIFTSQIKISIEENLLIVVRDYGDEKPSELLVRNEILQKRNR